MNCDELVEILRRYDVPFDHGAVKGALEAEESSPLGDWAKVHLTPDTLLTVDELLYYSALEKSGKADQLAASADLATVQSFSDQELRDAIEELNRSTDTIAKQTETLKQQQEALSRLMKEKAKEVENRAALELKRTQAWELNRKALGSDVEALAQTIGLRISDLEQHGNAHTDALRQTVNSMFVSDDKLFTGLQKLGWELEIEDPEEKEKESKLREICARLIKYTVETIRTRLDRLYLEAIEGSNNALTSGGTQADDVSELQEELESLYAEILPVAQMSVEEQFLGPALRSLSAGKGKSLVRSAHATDYIHDCLDYLLDRIQKISSRTETFQAHRTASHHLVAAARTELSVQVEPVRQKERRPTISSSPTRRRKSSTRVSAASPNRVRAPPMPRRRSSSGTGAAHADENPLEQLLRHLALGPPGDADADAGAAAPTPQQRAAALASALADRTSKAADVARNAHESFEAAAVEQVADAALALQLLRDSLLAESPFGGGRVTLADPETEASVEVLEQELEKVQVRLGGVDAELVKARGRKGKREEIVRRWGR